MSLHSAKNSERILATPILFDIELKYLKNLCNTPIKENEPAQI